MPPESVFSVVGVRADGTRLLIAEVQSAHEAVNLRVRLAATPEFEEILVEPAEADDGMDTVELSSQTIEM